jgi:hypothetical protein
MANIYVEARPKGRPEGDPIDDYVVEDHADHVLATFKSQHEAIAWAKKNGHMPSCCSRSAPQRQETTGSLAGSVGVGPTRPHPAEPMRIWPISMRLNVTDPEPEGQLGS